MVGLAILRLQTAFLLGVRNGLGDELIEALAAGFRLERRLLMEFGPDADNEFSTVGFSCGRRRQKTRFFEEKFRDVLLHDSAKPFEHPGFILSVASAVEQARAAADEATVFVGRFDDFQVAVPAAALTEAGAIG